MIDISEMLSVFFTRGPAQSIGEYGLAKNNNTILVTTLNFILKRE